MVSNQYSFTAQALLDTHDSIATAVPGWPRKRIQDNYSKIELNSRNRTVMTVKLGTDSRDMTTVAMSTVKVVTTGQS